MSKPEHIQRIGQMILSQDNRGTDKPLFAVMEKYEVVTLDTHEHDRIVWVNTESGDYEEADDIKADRLELKHMSGEETRPWERMAVKEVDRFVTACFTAQGCADYLGLNGHNLRRPFTYAFGSHRNLEWHAVRDWLAEQGAEVSKEEASKSQCELCNSTGLIYGTPCGACGEEAPAEQDKKIIEDMKAQIEDLEWQVKGVAEWRGMYEQLKAKTLELQAENEAFAKNLRGEHALVGATYKHLTAERDQFKSELKQWHSVFGHLGTPDEAGNTLIGKQDELESQAEQLKAENIQLKAALAESRSNDRAAMSYLQEVRSLVGGDDFPDMVERVKRLSLGAKQ